MRKVKVIEIDFTDLRDRFVRFVKDKRFPGQPILDKCWRDWEINARWIGGGVDDTVRWLEDGYFQESFTINEMKVQPRPRPRASWSEEDGEVDIGRLYGGNDDYMLTVADRESMPGVTLEIEYDFGASVASDMIAKYGAWLTKLISALEARGYDINVVLVVRATALFRDEGNSARTDIRINVKQIGAISDFTKWSALFAPTGFRHLIFTAYGLAAEATDKKLTNGLGGPVTSGWGIKRDEHVISITCDSRGGMAIPIDQLNDEAKKVGLI